MVVEALLVLMVFWKLRDWGISIVKTAGALALGAVLLLPLAPAGLWQRFLALLSDSDLSKVDVNSTMGSALVSLQERQQLLLRAVILTAENPIFGVGMNNFPAAAHARFDTGPGEWLGCHDTFLQISAELGISGLLLHLCLLYVTFKSLRQLRKNLHSARDTIPDFVRMRLATEATMVSFWGYGAFSVIAHLGYQPYFFIVAGIAQSLINLSSPVEKRVSAKRALTQAAVAA